MALLVPAAADTSFPFLLARRPKARDERVMNRAWEKRFFGIWAVVAVASGCGIIGYCSLTGQLAPEVFVGICMGSPVIGFVAAGCWYLVQYAREMRGPLLVASDLLPNEVIVMEAFAVHYRKGPSRLSEGVGGRLFLTTLRLGFVVHRGEASWRHRLFVSLEEVAKAEACKVLGGFPGGLRIEITGGAQELFGFGAFRYLEADRWAAAILLARYRAFPDRGEEPQTGDYDEDEGTEMGQ